MDELKRLLDEKGVDTATLRRLFEDSGVEVYGLTWPGAEAFDVWFVLRAALAGRGWWPVVLGREESVDRVGEDLEFNLDDTSPGAIVDKGLALDPDTWYAEHDIDGEPVAEWAVSAASNHTFTVHTDVLTRTPYPSVTIGLVPAAEPWEVPAYLGLGGWNECPSPEAHVAIMRRWHERFGAEIAGYAGDVVEMHVARPAADRATAEALAREQYMYCSDVVEQGVGDLGALTDTLLGATVWYFWWD